MVSKLKYFPKYGEAELTAHFNYDFMSSGSLEGPIPSSVLFPLRPHDRESTLGVGGGVFVVM